MKKKYVRPESRLYAINLAENIAGSGPVSPGDIMSGNMIIKFASAVDGCRGYYTDDKTAIVNVTSNIFSDYESELRDIVNTSGNLWTYFNCLASVRKT